jgi:hypothetical protein
MYGDNYVSERGKERYGPSINGVDWSDFEMTSSVGENCRVIRVCLVKFSFAWTTGVAGAIVNPILSVANLVTFPFLAPFGKTIMYPYHGGVIFETGSEYWVAQNLAVDKRGESVELTRFRNFSDAVNRIKSIGGKSLSDESHIS